jgi:uncharacterized delta-60 repeat protein
MFKKLSALSGALSLILTACGGSGSTPTGGKTYPSTVFLSAAFGPNAQCPAGGIEVQSGIDQNGNGLLDPNEVQSTQVLCNGTTGAPGVPGPQLPVALPLTLAPSPPPNGAAQLAGTFSGNLSAGDVLLADGKRSDYFAITVASGGVLALDEVTNGGRVAYFLFTSACATEPDVSRWGPCALGRLEALRVEPGQYILMVKQVAAVEPWESVAYGARARLFVNMNGLPVGAEDLSYGTSGLVEFLGTPVTSTWYPGEARIGFDATGRALLGWFSGDDLARVARLTTTGAFDTTFAGTGITATSLPTASLMTPIETAGGKLLVVSSSTPAYQVLRYLPDGTLDGGFGSGGIVTLPLAFTVARAPPVALADGSVLLGGSLADGLGNNRPAVTRLLASGALDSAFGVGGTGVLPVGTRGRFIGLALERDGTMLGCGAYNTGTGNDVAFVARLGADGAPIASFGTAGVVTFTFNEARAVQRTADGGILVGGGNWTNRTVFARLLSGGALDPTFAVGGLLTLNTGLGAAAVTFDLLDRPYVAAVDVSGQQPRLRRWFATGQPDAGFGVAGSVELRVFPDDLRFGPDGRLYVTATDRVRSVVQVARIK